MTHLSVVPVTRGTVRCMIDFYVDQGNVDAKRSATSVGNSSFYVTILVVNDCRELRI